MVIPKSPLEPFKEETPKEPKVKAPKVEEVDNAFRNSAIEKYPTGKALQKKIAKDEEQAADLKAGKL